MRMGLTFFLSFMEFMSGCDHEVDEFGALYINTLEGTMMANNGDYIIRGVKGEYYPCKPDIFEATYEAVK